MVSRAEGCPDDGLTRPFGDIDSDVATEVLLNSLKRTVQRVVHMNKIIGDKYVSDRTKHQWVATTVTGASALPELNAHGHCHSNSPSRVRTLTMHHGLNIDLRQGRVTLSPVSQRALQS